MFYAASEIIFWILLAAIVGGGIGYGLSEAKSVRLNKRLSQSGADAPMERELAIAWDTIEDLNKRLQVAHETIRDSVTAELAAEGELSDEPAEDEPDSDADEPTEDEPTDSVDDKDDTDTVVDMSSVKPATTNGSKGKRTSKKTTKKATATLSDDTVGTRLSERVASASSAKNQVDFTDGELSAQ